MASLLHTQDSNNIKHFQTKHLCTVTRLKTARQNDNPKKHFKIDNLKTPSDGLLKSKQANSLMPLSFTEWIVTEEVEGLLLQSTCS